MTAATRGPVERRVRPGLRGTEGSRGGAPEVIRCADAPCGLGPVRLRHPGVRQHHVDTCAAPPRRHRLSPCCSSAGDGQGRPGPVPPLLPEGSAPSSSCGTHRHHIPPTREEAFRVGPVQDGRQPGKSDPQVSGMAWPSASEPRCGSVAGSSTTSTGRTGPWAMASPSWCCGRAPGGSPDRSGSRPGVAAGTPLPDVARVQVPFAFTLP